MRGADSAPAADRRRLRPCCGKRRTPRAAGFTLVEVMVALAVVAVALPALLLTLDQQVDGTAYLRDKSLAQLVAANKLSELRLRAAATGTVLRGRESGELELAERTWYWSLQGSDTELPGLVRVVIQVGLEPLGVEASARSNHLLRLTAYLGSGEALSLPGPAS